MKKYKQNKKRIMLVFVQNDYLLLVEQSKEEAWISFEC